MQHVTTAHGLPTQLALGAAIHTDGDALCVATTNGMSRGWFDARWQAQGARDDEKGVALSACMTLPAGRAFAGGVGGLLLRWHGSSFDSLRIPTRTGRVLALAMFTSWLDTHTPSAQGVAKTGEPLFPLGLAAALDNDGVWLLRSTAPVRWLRFVGEDGLPSHRVRHLVTDSSGRLWVATDRGIAWIGPDLGVHSFPADALLSQRAHVLLEGADGHLYVGLDTGLACLSLAAPEVGATLVPGVPGPVVALAHTDDAIWWSDGERVRSSTGRDLVPPADLADNHCIALLASAAGFVHFDRAGEDAPSTPPATNATGRTISVWVGHPFGRASALDASEWFHYGIAQGLPTDDITSFERDNDSLFVGTAASGLFVGHDAPRRARLPRISHASVHKAMAGQPHFAPVAGAPTHVSTQAFARGLHWVGGRDGLAARRDGIWERLPLWPGATEVVDVVAATETLWVSAGAGGLAYHDGRTWILPPRAFDVLGAWYGRLSRAADGRLAVATDRGLVLWNGSTLKRVAGSPDAFVTDVVWWGAEIAVGTHRGLWVHRADGTWSVRGVLAGLPGAQIRALDVDPYGSLWVATTRGLGRLQQAAPDAESSLGVLLPQHNAAEMPSSLASIAVYDVRGRLVRRLAPDGMPTGRWDGRDASGHAVARGVYFLRLVNEPSGRVSRQIVLR